MDNEYTLAEVAQHTSRESCWLAIHGKVYDVSAFLDEHPGGAEIILEESRAGGNTGHDASEIFDLIGHSEDALATLKTFLKGSIRGSKSVKAGLLHQDELPVGLWRSLKWVPAFFKFGGVYVLSQILLHKIVPPSPTVEYAHYFQRMHSVSQYVVSSCHCLSSAAAGLRIMDDIKKLPPRNNEASVIGLQTSSTLGKQLHVEAGYYVFDTIADAFGMKLRNTPITRLDYVWFLHHLVPLLGCGPLVRWRCRLGNATPFTEFCSGALLASTFSTALANFRSICDALSSLLIGMKAEYRGPAGSLFRLPFVRLVGRMMYYANFATFLFSYGIGRVLFFPYVFHRFALAQNLYTSREPSKLSWYDVLSAITRDVPHHIPAKCSIGSLVLTITCTYFYVLNLTKAAKMMKKLQ